MRKRRRRVWRALLSALAGGGLTAAALSGPLTAAALGAAEPDEPVGTPTVPTAPVVTGAGAQEAVKAQPTKTTSPKHATKPSPKHATKPSPKPSPSTSTSPSGTTCMNTRSQPASGAPSSGVPAASPVALQHKQKATSGRKAPSSSATTNTTPKAGATGATGARRRRPQQRSPPRLSSRPERPAHWRPSWPSSAASAQALSFYRIPLFLLPIYETASLQYGVPWQILAAINEIETNYGTDQSTAGAVGWMQFMPATWTAYGVDAFRAGYADRYNPVDAIFAAARYLRAAGVQQDLRTAIRAYNH